jgi:hypothetical protein
MKEGKKYRLVEPINTKAFVTKPDIQGVIPKGSTIKIVKSFNGTLIEGKCVYFTVDGIRNMGRNDGLFFNYVEGLEPYIEEVK